MLLQAAVLLYLAGQLRSSSLQLVCLHLQVDILMGTPLLAGKLIESKRLALRHARYVNWTSDCDTIGICSWLPYIHQHTAAIVPTPAHITPASCANSARVKSSLQRRFLVLDEGDRLLDEQFVEQVDAVLAACTSPKLVWTKSPWARTAWLCVVLNADPVLCAGK